jgi:hypothetical protein
LREHRSKHAAKIIPFPRPEEDWPREIIARWTKQAELVRAYVETGMLPIDALLWVQREGFGMLTLYQAGLPPSKIDAFVRGLAPKWAELMTLIADNQDKAKAMLAKRRLSNG